MTKRSAAILLLVACAFLSTIPAAPANEPPITALAFDAEERNLLIGSQAGVRVVSWPGLAASDPIPTKLKQIHDIRFSPDGKHLAIAGGVPGEEGGLELWNWPKRSLARTIAPHDDVIHHVCWSTDSKTLFTAGHDMMVLRLSADTGEILQTFQGHSQPVRSLVILDREDILLSAGADQTIRVWDLNKEGVIRSFNNHTKAIRQLVLRPESEPDSLPMIASIARDRTLRLWQPTIGRMVRFKRFSGQPLAAGWSRTANRIIVADEDGTIHQLDADTLESQKTWKTRVPNPISLILTKAGDALVVAGDDGQFQGIRIHAVR